jgi:hypothetical protein
MPVSHGKALAPTRLYMEQHQRTNLLLYAQEQLRFDCFYGGGRTKLSEGTIKGQGEGEWQGRDHETLRTRRQTQD